MSAHHECLLDAHAGAIASTSDQSPRCIAGMTFSVAIFAVLRIPQRTLLIMLRALSIEFSLTATGFRQLRAAPRTELYENGTSTAVVNYQSIFPKSDRSM